MSVFNIYNKEEHLRRALDLLSSSNKSEHVYACLELRFCIEAIVYQKLLHGIDELPNTIVETWQPNKALKMLVEFDRLTATDCSIEVNLSNSIEPPKDGWLLLGQQKLPPVRWLNKSYNKLGNFLHLVEPKKVGSSNSKSIKESVLEIAEQLEEYVKGNIVINFRGLSLSRCPLCEQDIAFSLQNLRNGDICKCSNYNCGALLKVTVNEQSQEINLSCDIFDIECQRCHSEIAIHESTIRKLETFKCSSCCAEYIPKGTYEFALIE
ncbi:hypothetical protein HR45_16455 [Shewanella mangrovi]|uniref:Uncharacterized protein n=1 Tax=Shewanella mangrovi TaxID=1515746 RepID=A0A094LMS4_9GAMM|nr:hypothetical protein [Shewanella mangrovi]KFZ36413.1 hypothetical protein HR45_16455 [Shewanella mangrovi]